MMKPHQLRPVQPLMLRFHSPFVLCDMLGLNNWYKEINLVTLSYSAAGSLVVGWAYLSGLL